MGNKRKPEEERVKLDIKDSPIDKTWLASEVGMSRQSFYCSLNQGFTKDNAKKVRSALQELGLLLLTAKIPVRVFRPQTEFLDEDEE